MRYVSALALALVAASLAGCGSQATTPSAVTDAAGLPADNVIVGVNHHMTREGIRTGVLQSDSAYLYEESRKMDLRGVLLKFYGDNGVETGTLTSRTGEYDLATGSFVAHGGVVLLTEGPKGPRRLETEELHFDVDNDRLWSDVPFVMHEGQGSTRGSSFRSDSKFRNWSVTGAETSGGLPESGGISF